MGRALPRRRRAARLNARRVERLLHAGVVSASAQTLDQIGRYGTDQPLAQLQNKHTAHRLGSGARDIAHWRTRPSAGHHTIPPAAGRPQANASTGAVAGSDERHRAEVGLLGALGKPRAKVWSRQADQSGRCWAWWRCQMGCLPMLCTQPARQPRRRAGATYRGAATDLQPAAGVQRQGLAAQACSLRGASAWLLFKHQRESLGQGRGQRNGLTSVSKPSVPREPDHEGARRRTSHVLHHPTKGERLCQPLIRAHAQHIVAHRARWRARGPTDLPPPCRHRGAGEKCGGSKGGHWPGSQCGLQLGPVCPRGR